jgi:hypothetical protein
MIQIFVRKEPKHGLTCGGGSTGEEASAHPTRIKPPLDLTPQRPGLFLTGGQIGFHLGCVIQKIRDNLVNVGESQRRELLCNFLRRCAGTKRANNAVERNARAAHPDNPVGISSERNLGGGRRDRHEIRVAILVQKTRVDCSASLGRLLSADRLALFSTWV